MHSNLISDDYLMHHGVKGMKWGVRQQKRELRQAIRQENKALKAYKKQGQRYKRNPNEQNKQKSIKLFNDYQTAFNRAEKISKGKQFVHKYDFKKDKYYLAEANRKYHVQVTGNTIVISKKK